MLTPVNPTSKFQVWHFNFGGGGDSFANITLAITSRCFLVLLLSLGALIFI